MKAETKGEPYCLAGHRISPCPSLNRNGSQTAPSNILVEDASISRYAMYLDRKSSPLEQLQYPDCGQIWAMSPQLLL